MFDSQVLDVAIGLVLMFFTLALISSSIVEAISGFLRIRAKQLEGALTELVGDPKKLYDTSVLSALTAGSSGAKKGTRVRKPSYMSARAFADATMEMIATIKGTVGDAAALEQQLPATLKRRLDTITNEVGHDLTAIKAGLESWFDDTMERAAGAFKRLSQIIVFVVAVVLAVSLNASTTRVAATLWNQPAVRDALVQAAKDTVSSTTTTPTPTTAIGAAARTAAVAGASASTAAAGDTTTTEAPPLKGLNDVADKIKGLKSLGFPIGWNDWDSYAGGFGTAVGWLLTALLVMLGAPFWYGILTRLVSLRAAGDKPPTADGDTGSATAALAARQKNPASPTAPAQAASLSDVLSHPTFGSFAS
jgi:hypothetical protein